jgi:hypothetical protein
MNQTALIRGNGDEKLVYQFCGMQLNDVNVLKKNPPPVVVGGRVGPLLGHPMNPIIESARSTKTNFFILVAS